MFRKSFKVLSKLLAIALIMSVFAGAAVAEEAKPEGWGEETLEITVAVMTGFTQQGSEIQKMLEDRYNVKFNLVVLPGWSDGQSKINLLMADESQRPDVMWWWGMDKEFKQWTDAGLLADLTEYWVKYPNIREYFDKFSPISPFYFANESGSTFRVGDVAEPCCMTLMIRQDWMDKLGLEQPKTIDELREVMRAFTFNDPDGNGQNDTFGLHGANEYRSLQPFFAAFESIPDQFVRVGDEVKYGAALPETKAALAYIADMYKEGLIDPDITIKDFNYDEAFVRGGHGLVYRWIALLNPGVSMLQSFEGANPGGKWSSIAPVTGPTGYSSDRVEEPGAWCYFAITDKAKDPERIFAIFDDLVTPEMFQLTAYGVKDRDYTYEDGIYTNTLTEDDNLANNIGRGLFSNFVARKDESLLENTPEVAKAFADGAVGSQPDRDRIVFFKNAERPIWNSHKADMDAMRDEYLWGIIAGQRPIDDFDKFVELFYANGGAEIEAEATAYAAEQEIAYQQYLEAK